MAGFVPDEGDEMNVQQTVMNITTDRGTDSELLLFTNVAPAQNITAAALNEPVGTGYARIPLVDGTWTGSGAGRTYPEQTFLAGAGGWAGTVQGYAVVSNGTTSRIMAIEVDPVGPYNFDDGDTYRVTPTVTAS